MDWKNPPLLALGFPMELTDAMWDSFPGILSSHGKVLKADWCKLLNCTAGRVILLKKRKYHHNSGCCKAVLINTEFGEDADDADDNIFSPVKWREVNAKASDDVKYKGGQGEDTG